jgi:hypothetical protein
VSQYPYTQGPYVPPTPEYHPPSGWAPPDRNATVAGVLQVVLGSLMFLAGTCMGATIWLAGMDAVLTDLKNSGRALPDIPGHDPVAVAKAGMIGAFVAMVVAGAVLTALSPFVFRRRRGAIIASMVVLGAIGLMVLLSVLAGISELGLDPAEIFYVAVLAYCIGTLVSLLRALRGVPDPRTVAAMQQAWYHWMQQQQYAEGYGQGYGQHSSGSGYVAAPTPAPGPAAPAPLPPADGSTLPPPPSA